MTEEDLYGMGKDDDGDGLSDHDGASLADDSTSIPPTPSSTAAPLFPPPLTPAKHLTEVKSPTQTKSKIIPGPSPTATRKLTLDSTAQRPNFVQPNTPSRSSSGNGPSSISPSVVPTTRSTSTSLPPIRYATAASASVGPPGLSQPSPASVPAPGSISTTAESRQASTVSSPDLMRASIPDSISLPSSGVSPSLAPMEGYPNGGASQSNPAGVSPIPSSNSLPHSNELASVPASTEPRLPSSLADLVASFESAKQKCKNNSLFRGLSNTDGMI